jgi:hypothetical protein
MRLYHSNAKVELKTSDKQNYMHGTGTVAYYNNGCQSLIDERFAKLNKNKPSIFLMIELCHGPKYELIAEHGT